MLNIKNTIAIIALVLFGTKGLYAETYSKGDTVKINFGQSHMIFVIENESDLESLKTYNMDELVAKFKPLLDSAEKRGGTLNISENKKNNSIVVAAKDDDGVEYIIIESGKGMVISGNKKDKRSTHGLHIDFGLNNYLGGGRSNSGEEHRLKNWGSRYFGLTAYHKIKLGKNKGPMNIQFGTEVAWNNFMFQEDITLRSVNADTRIINLTNEGGINNFDNTLSNGIPAKKSKLTVATLGIPLLVGFDLGKEDDVSFALGGYINYKLASYTRVLYFENGDKRQKRDHSDYNLHDWNYGAMFTFNYKGFSVFGKYNISPLFSQNPIGTDGNRTQDFNVYSFGIRI